MSLLKTFKEYLRVCKDKNLLIRPLGQNINLLPTNLINEISYPPQIPETEPKQNDADLVKKHYEKIGKGSMFERKNVESYLKSLGPTSLKRSSIDDHELFNEQEAKEKHVFYKNLESLDNSSTVLFNLEQEDIRHILENLVTVTPKSSESTNSLKISMNDEAKKFRKKPSPHIYTEIPPVPDFHDSVSTFEDYIYLLTHSTFHHKKSSNFNGIIPKILKNFFHPLNSNTIPLRTVNSYNDAIHYFSNKWNIATCRELLVQMKLENIKPNSTTFNIMLKSLLTHQNIRHVTSPYKIALKYLLDMKRYGVEADLVTWNLIFNLLKDDISKKLLLDNRKLLNLPADPYFLTAAFKHLSFQEDLSSRALLKLMKDFDISFDVKLLNVMVKKLIKEKQILSAWKVIDHSRKEFNFRPNVEQLNLFLVHFSNIGRVDLVVATMNTFKKHFKVKPNYDSYNLVMKSISRSKHWDDKLHILRILYHKMMADIKNCVAGEYWIRRIRARLKFIYEKDVQLQPELTSEELQLKAEIETIKWGFNTGDGDLSKRIPEQFREVSAKLGFQGVCSDLVAIEDLEMKKEKMRKYKDRIDFLSIQKSLVKRIPYAEDSYTALKQEMKARKLIEV